MNRALQLLVLLSACSPGDVIRGGAAPEGGMPGADGSMPPTPGADGSASANDGATPGDGDDADGDGDGDGDGGDGDADGGDGDADGGDGDGGNMPPPDGLVPVFVAVGYQSHRIISCDQGLTWGHDEMSATGGGDDPTLMRGLAYGLNKFVSAVGGGGSQELWTSENGVDWTVWKNPEPGSNGFSDVTFGNGRFVAGGGHVSLISTDGVNWQMPGKMGEGGILRNLAFLNYMGGRFAAVGDQGRRMNSQDGVNWGHQVQEGDTLEAVAGGNGVFVAVASTGATRYSTNGGDSWNGGNVGTGSVRGIIHDGQKFIVTTDSGTYFSTHGQAWDAKGGGAGPYDFAVNDDRTHYAGVDGNQIFHSTNGINWTRVHDGGPGYERVKFGWVKPSAACPLP